MKVVAISQRVAVDPKHGERRDCLDQAWAGFLLACGLCPTPVPNAASAARSMCAEVEIGGVLLTGGNDLAAYGGDAPERDATEAVLLDYAEDRALPVIGVCRGMQVILHRQGVKLERVEGHVAVLHGVRIDGRRVEVNSYHNFAAFDAPAPLEPWAVADDGVVEAVRTQDRRVVGVMWHPERMAAFEASDIDLFRRVFGV
jgi:putative glutamine amidotransferase